MLLKRKIFNILIILLLIIFTNEEEEKTETCDNKEEKEKTEYKLIYDNFLNQDVFQGDGFDFEINEKVIDFIKKNDILHYPRSKFRGEMQGNFLHFMHLVYSKKLPLYFTVDQIIYPYIEITKDIIQIIIEKGLYNIFHNFLKQILDYGYKNNYDKKLLTYFSIGFKFLDNETKIENDEVISDIIENILDISNSFADPSDYYNITLLGYERNINKINFVKIDSIFNKNEKTKSLFHCITFFQNFIFNIRNELFTIYSIGEIIDKSGQSKKYKELKIFFKYLFNEEENMMNPLEIYEYINNNFENKTKTEKDINFNLYYKIKDIILKNSTLSFMSKYEFYDVREETEFNNQKKIKMSLFSYPYTFEEWINYKLVNIIKKRMFPSFYEFISIMHNGNKMNELILDRYNYKGRNSTNGIKKRMIKFRDGINMEKEFNETKEIIDKSLINEYNKWENSYENSFNYLLNIIGHSKDEFYDINNINNKDIELKKKEFEGKIFNTLIGSYLHFKKDILLFEQFTRFQHAAKGSLVDVYIEDNTKFYEELNKTTLLFKDYCINIIKNINNIHQRNKLTSLVEKKLNFLFIAYENIKKILYYQKQNIDDEKKQNLIKNMFYYNKDKKIYDGWYVDLYKKEGEKNGNEMYYLKIYAYNYCVSRPVTQMDFKGAIIYGAMNYPQYSLIAIDDKFNKTKKLYIMSYYSGNEYPHGWSEEIDFDSLKTLIYGRK